MASILVIDDSPTTVAFLRSTLRKAGHRVETLGSFVELPARLASDPPDVVVLDLQMPAMNGVAVASFVRRLQKTPIAIVIYSSQPEDELRAAGREVRADATLSKSSDPTALIETIDSLVQKRAATS